MNNVISTMGAAAPFALAPVDRMDSQAALRTSEMRYRRLFEAACDGILIVDPVTRKITDANPFMTELLGYSHEELLGTELWEIGLLKDEEASREAFRELQQKHYIRYEDLPLQTKAGRRHEVEFVSNLYQEGDQAVIQCNIRDITERKRTENELRDAKNQLANQAIELERVVVERTGTLQATVRELQAFSYSVSHDMRAPLRSMQGFAQFLLDGYRSKLDDKGVDYLEQIMRSAKRLDRLVQDVLSYSTVLHVEVLAEPVDLDRLIRDIIETYPKGNGTEIHIQGTLPKVRGNEAFLTQCFSNLLSNAAKFVSRGTLPRIVIRAEVRESSECGADEKTAAASSARQSPGAATVRIWVEDNGIGIAPENHDRIFRIFERIHPTEEHEGTGIGLAIVRKAAERMGAQFGLESELGKGSGFWIQLQKG